MSAAGRILVVDDEKNLRVTLAQILGDEGYSVETCASGEAAIEECRQQAFDLVLMDVRMPGIDGVEAFRTIRQRRPGARVVLMSAFTDEETRVAALKDGATAFLRKPFNIPDVLELIEEIQGS